MAGIVRRLARIAAQGMDFGGYEGVGPGVRLNPYGAGYYGIPGAEFDYAKEAGNPWDNSIIAIALSWLWERFPQAEPVIEQRRRGGTWEPITNHPAGKLLRQPNGQYDIDTLLNGFVLGDALSGNAYFFINRSKARMPAEIYCLPYFQCEPKWKLDSGNFIDHYEYQPMGRHARIYAPEDVIHIKHGIDPINSRLGFSRSARMLRQIATDNTIATAAAALMRNGGLLGLMVSPESVQDMIPDEQIEKLMTLGRQKIVGERRGEPWVQSIPTKIQQFGYSPKDMSFNETVQIPEERIAAAFGIPITVLQLHAGLQRTSENNVGEAKREAYEGGLCPRWDRLGKALTRQLLTQFGDDPERTRVRFDYSQIPALQEDVSERHKRARENWLAGGIDINEYRQEIGKPPINDGDGQFHGATTAKEDEDPEEGGKNNNG